jgi:hypothetical protein
MRVALRGVGADASGTPRRPPDWWAPALFVVHLAHGIAVRLLYPHAIHDPDLLAYFVYFRSWLAGSEALHDLPYFTVPKPLLVLALGPLGDASAAFAVSAVASAALGCLVYLVGRAAFGRGVGALVSLLLLLDVEKAVLTLRSSADLFVAVLLFATIHCSLRRRFALSAVSLLLSALVKPVTIPCALHFLAVDDVPWRRRLAWAALPAASLPLTLLANHLLLGTAMAPERFFAGFDALGEGTAIGPADLMRYVLWLELVKHAFVATAPLGVLGLVAWVARDRRRLTSPILLVPLLFLGGYLGLSVVAPFVPFFRFFWPVKVWFAGFVVFGAVQAARRVVPAAPRLRLAAAGALLFFLADDYLVRLLSYRERFAEPFEHAMAFVTRTSDVLREERRDGETILAPLAFMPYLLWELRLDAEPRTVVTAEEAARRPDAPAFDWVLHVPEITASLAAREHLTRVGQSGRYDVRLVDGPRALLAPRGAERLAASGAP